MARIFIAEPTPEVRRLVAHVVSRLGHEPVVFGEGGEHDRRDVDAAVLEPVFSVGLAAVLSLRVQNPDLPIICASIHPRTPLVAALAPVAFVPKPFRLAELKDALRAAVSLATDSARPAPIANEYPAPA